jgi:succinoglycan biosynthesis protein ExoM
MTLSVCIATYRRADRLEVLLQDLRAQSLLPDQVIVVDNDAAGSARSVVERFRAQGAPFEIDYAVQPERNIAKTRNRTVALARCDWFAFIDDDERAPATWLQRLMEAAAAFNADGVLSPVEPRLPASAPEWIRRGHFYDFPRQPEGAVVPLPCMRFGNVLLRAAWVRAEPGPFDERYALAVGEDAHLLVRLVHKGARIVWTESAPVFEPVETARLTLRWLLRRAFAGGQEFGRQTVRGSYAPIGRIGCALFFARALLQLLSAAALALLFWPAGRHEAVRWLIKVWANCGKLTALRDRQSQAYS